MRETRFIFMLLIGIGLAVYLPFALRSGFVAFDDDKLITMNPVVQEFSLRTVQRAWTSYDPELYVPLTLMTYQIENAIAGNSPAVFHLTNLLLHLLSVALLFVIIRRMSGSDLAAGAGAALFLLHPIQTEAVLWASARKDLLSGMFALAALLEFLRWRDTESSLDYWLCAGAFVAGLLSKVTIVLLPVTFLAIDAMQGRGLSRDTLRSHALFAALSVVFIVIALLGKTTNLSSIPALLLPLLAAKSLVMMLVHIVWPARLNLLYPHMTMDIGPLLPFGFGAALVVIAGVIIARRWSALLPGMALGVAAFLPSAATFMKNGLLYFGSDRYAYLVMAGIAMMAGVILARTSRAAQAGMLALCMVVCIPLTVRQAGTWQSTATLFTRAVAMNPDNALAQNNLGAGYLEREDTQKARLAFEAAIALDPHYAQPYINIAMLERQAGHSDKALQAEEAAVRAVSEKQILLPDDVNAHAILAQTYLERGRADDALIVLADAARRAPDSPQAYYNLGAALYEARRTQDAAVTLRRAVELSPRSVEARYLLAAVLGETGDLSGARDQLRAVVRLAPGYERAEEHLRSIEARINGEGIPR